MEELRQIIKKAARSGKFSIMSKQLFNREARVLEGEGFEIDTMPCKKGYRPISWKNAIVADLPEEKFDPEQIISEYNGKLTDSQKMHIFATAANM